MSFWLWQWVVTSDDNFGRVTGSIYRSAEPDAAKLARWQHTYQLGAVLNLRAEAGLEEQEEVAKLGLLWYGVPMRDDAAPTHDQVANALRVMRSGIFTLVCCKGGRHRTGLIVASYRVAAQGWTKDEAWREAERYGWYDFGGHKPLRLWFEQQFRTEDFK